jgi:hypothetical protein
MNPIFMSVKVPANHPKKGLGTARANYSVSNSVLIKKVTFSVRETIATKDTAPFLGGLKARIDGMEAGANIDVAMVSRMPTKTLEFSTPLHNEKGTHLILFENESTHHVTLDIVLDGTDG